MNYPDNINEKLGFDKVIELLQNKAHTDFGKNYVKKIVFSSKINLINKWLTQTSEILQLRNLGLRLNFPEKIEPLGASLTSVSVEGYFLLPADFHQWILFLEEAQDVFDFIKKNSEDTSVLHLLANEVPGMHSLIKLLNKTFDKEGNIRPDASDKLKVISAQIKESEIRVRKVLTSKFEFVKKNGWVGDGEITIRNDRLVLPILAEHKRKIQGFVHDESSTGKFYFIEPIECFEENNILKELMLDRKREVERILKDLTLVFSQNKSNLSSAVKIAGKLDFIQSRALLGIEIEGIIPEFKAKPQTKLIGARHPLLELNLKKENRKIVALDLELNDLQRIIVISGPNAGGKSIALKTIGLIQLMFQCGIPVPVSKESVLGIYDSIFIDIGDNQSIENNLSSYSSHLRNMQFFLANAKESTLFLADEMGNGTDPALGGPIAEAILHRLYKTKAKGVVTTHFGDIKALASSLPEMLNASMLYDLENLVPLFKMKVGQPGSSFTFEVARKIGLMPEVLNEAKNKSKVAEYHDFEKLFADLEAAKAETEKLRKSTLERENLLEKLIHEYDILKNNILKNKNMIIKNAKEEALRILNNANKDVELTIKEIKEKNAEGPVTKQIRKKIEQKKESLTKEITKEIFFTKDHVNKELNIAIVIGSKVKIKDYEERGEILEIKKNKVLVSVGLIKFWTDIQSVSVIQPNNNVRKKKTDARLFANIIEKQANFNSILDLRGERGEDAIKKVSIWLDDAYVLGNRQLKIIHGRGSGILRKLVTDYIKTLTFIKSYKYEREDLGGDGATIIELF